MKYFIVICLAAFSFALPIAAQTPTSETPILATQEQTAREVGRALRCVVCQNQSIEDSDAPLAADMRALVRRRLAAGDDPEAVIAFMQERYGDYVLLKPPVQGNTYILWFAPFALLGAALIYVVRRPRGERPAMPAPLSEDEARALEHLKQQAGKDGSV